jgi:DNA polymerase delta subunit 1
VLFFSSEEELLLSWAHFLRLADPDAIGLFQVNDTLAVLTQRFESLGLSTPGDGSSASTVAGSSGSSGSAGSVGRGLRLSRLLPRSGKPVGIHKVTNYSAQWAKDKQRLSAGSNQETWRVKDMDGRLVVDVVRHAIAAQSQLASYSFADCVQTLLGETLEVLRPCRLAALAGIAGPPQQPLHRQLLPPAAAAEADAMRLARYALRRCDAVCSLLHRLATVPDTVEMARACGLTLRQAMYNGAMQRVHSLLLRAARRRGFLMPVQMQKSDLKETTFIQHPVECGTVGLYKDPVAILDFASLYPSIYRAYNLCYSTLLHDAQDVARLPPDAITVSPRTVEDARTGQKGWGQGPAFVKPEVRRGVLPDVLTALVTARAATRELLRGATDPATRAVLECRQRALKITANAVYGFTGTNVSPLQVG